VDPAISALAEQLWSGEIFRSDKVASSSHGLLVRYTMHLEVIKYIHSILNSVIEELVSIKSPLLSAPASRTKLNLKSKQ